MTAAILVAVGAGLALAWAIYGALDRIAHALGELARIAGLEHAVHEQERRARDDELAAARRKRL